MSRALKLLARRSRSEGELRDRLLANSRATPEEIQSCIARLKELGLVDDRRFVESYARSRLSSKPVGRQRLARQLAAKAVDRKTIDEVLSQIFEIEDEESLLVQVIENHVRLHGRPQDRTAKARLFAHLARRGFEYDLIRRNLQAISKGIDDDDGA
jgi:regulatory protein